VGEASEPKLKKYYAVAAREAALWAWGPGGVEDIASHMPELERGEMFAEVLPPWVAERTMIALGFGIWNGPAKRSKTEYFRFLHKTTDMSFGRVRKALLGVLASPEKVLTMADELWKSDHTHGSWETHIAPNRARMRLTGHPYADTPHGRTSLAEQIRYIVQLTRARNVTASFAPVGPSAMEITLRWK
jgi:hypothetical protein